MKVARSGSSIFEQKSIMSPVEVLGGQYGRLSSDIDIIFVQREL